MRLSAQTHPDKIQKPNSKIFQLVGAIYEKITEK
jgi:curved DNA-binding protein CbpA